jgi:glycine hydroxymethyltransferase
VSRSASTSQVAGRRDPALGDPHFQSVFRRLDGEATLQTVRWVEALAHGHAAFRRAGCLNLDPEDPAMSRRCRAVLHSELGAADRARGGRTDEFVSELEAIIAALARRLFGAGYVEWRCSGAEAARAAVLSALVEPDEAVIALDGSAPEGAGPRHRRTLVVEQTGDFGVDLAALADAAGRIRPKAIVVGGPSLLFPLPVTELRRIADRSRARLVYDAGVLGLQIAGGRFQSPLQDGADVVVAATQGPLGGPPGALVMTDDIDFACAISAAVAEGPLRDERVCAALAIALGEALAYGPDLAAASLANARALARGLEDCGLLLAGAGRGHTQSHQLVVRLGADAEAVVARCEEASIRVRAAALPGDRPGAPASGRRLSVHEMTRRGMGEAEMLTVARILAPLLSRQVDADQQIAAVADLLARFPGLPFSFDEAP